MALKWIHDEKLEAYLATTPGDLEARDALDKLQRTHRYEMLEDASGNLLLHVEGSHVWIHPDLKKAIDASNVRAGWIPT